MHRFDRKIIDRYGITGKKKVRKEAYIQMGISITNTRLEKILGRCRRPVFMIYGKEDKVCSISTAKQLLKKEKGSFTFTSIPEAGHIVNMEKPYETAAAIKKYLSLPETKTIKNKRNIL
jgi:pimeloyl-ACP methyl ester carboxylesterase